MQFSIDPKILECFPNTNIGVVLVKGANNAGSVPDELTHRIAGACAEIRANLSGEAMETLPRIRAWREAYNAFRGQPKKNRSSIENLCRLILGGRELRSVNKLVDIYNLVSIQSLLPVGGEDLSQIFGDISLTFASANEPAVLLLGDSEPHAPHPGEVIYKDSNSAICRRWNWREADRTKLTEQTENCVLVIEGILPDDARCVETATGELASLVKIFCGGQTKMFMLNKAASKVELDS